MIGRATWLYTVADIRTIEARHLSVTDPPLMERAGAAAAQDAFDILQDRPGCVLILAGPGNNGGDAFVVARRLRASGRDVVVACLTSPDAMPKDAKVAYASWISAGGSVVRDFVGNQWALAIDGILGIGNRRPLQGRFAEWAERLNAMQCPVLALDIPTGLDADSGEVIGDIAVKASHTSTFIGIKPGMLTMFGPDLCGRIRVHDLDLPVSEGSGRCVGLNDFGERLKPRLRQSHKGTYGEVGIIGGAAGMFGAALLAGRAALNLGAGRVYVGMLGSDAPPLDYSQPELMLRPATELHVLARALAIGPGLGQSEAAYQQVQRAAAFPGALVLDADALNLLSAHPNLHSLLASRAAPLILTPHPAEAGRLLGQSVADVQADRIGSTVTLARRFSACVVLKGNGSVLAMPDRRWFINTTGNPGLASAGTGDVLTGFIVALLAQGWPAEQALLCAVHLHGAAADYLVQQGIGPVGMTAGELSSAARGVFNDWLKREGK